MDSEPCESEQNVEGQGTLANVGPGDAPCRQSHPMCLGAQHDAPPAHYAELAGPRYRIDTIAFSGMKPKWTGKAMIFEGRGPGREIDVRARQRGTRAEIGLRAARESLLARWAGERVYMSVNDYEAGRACEASVCSVAGTLTMPQEERVWELAELIESAAEVWLEPGTCRVSRVDFARDVRLPFWPEMFGTWGALLLSQHIGRFELYAGRSRGLTLFGVAGCDRVRIYHKGMETKVKHKLTSVPEALRDVWRVEAQLRRGQLPEECRSGVGAVKEARVMAAPTEDDRHPRKLPTLATLVTRRVDGLLVEGGFADLVPGRGAGSEVETVTKAGQ